MAKQKVYSSGQPPSAWAIVLVAALLILLPSLFCGGILLMSSPGSSTQPVQHNEPIKRPDLNP